jgi:hypothetical protein
LFALFSTFAVYNGQRLIKSKQPPQTPWLTWVKRHERMLYLATFASSLLTVSTLLMIGKLSWESLVLLGITGVVSFFYVFRVKGKNLREVPYMKIHFIAFTWAAVLILFPMLNEKGWSEDVIWQSIAHYFFVLALGIPFDIRDVKYDSASQKTIPQVLGIVWAKVISTVFLFTFMAIMLLVNEVFLVNYSFYFAGFILFLLILFTNEDRGDLYCGGAIDGSIGLIGLSYFLM